MFLYRGEFKNLPLLLSVTNIKRKDMETLVEEIVNKLVDNLTVDEMIGVYRYNEIIENREIPYSKLPFTQEDLEEWSELGYGEVNLASAVKTLTC